MPESAGFVDRRAGLRRAFVNARLLDPASKLDAPGALLSEGTRILDVGPRVLNDGLPQGAEVIDCGGRCLAPGLIDMRVQLREPGEEHKETIPSGSRAAAAGGVTAMVCLPNTAPPVDDVSVVEFLARRARETNIVKIYTYGAVTRGFKGREMTELGILASAGVLAFTDGIHAVADALVMRRVLSYAKTFGLLIIQHPEDPSLAAGGTMNEGEVATRLGLPGIPAVAEVMMIERDLRLVELTGGRYHVAHVSTAEAVEAIRKAKARGLDVTCDTAPPYFTLNETAVGEYRTFAKLSPPLRREADRLAIVEGLADGTIDAIASDHAPQDQESKRLPFIQAEYGMIGLETLLPLSLALYHQKKLSLLDMLGLLTARPGAILKLKEGTLKRGQPADLVLFDPEREWRTDPTKFHSKSKNTLFEDYPMKGRVIRTIVGGRTVFERPDA